MSRMIINEAGTSSFCACSLRFVYSSVYVMFCGGACVVGSKKGAARIIVGDEIAGDDGTLHFRQIFLTFVRRNSMD